MDGEIVVGFDLERLEELLPRASSRGLHLGVSIANARAAGNRPAGVYVGEIKADTPADRAGVRKGDIITEMAREPVRNADDLRKIASEVVLGSVVPLTVWRSGHRLRLLIHS